MEAQRFAWVLNLDADVELAVGPNYEPRKRSRLAMLPHVQRLASTLLGPDDLQVAEGDAPGTAKGFIGRAFCPTPRACAILSRAGATIEPHPSFDVLRAVNSRAFASALGPTLPGASFVTTIEDARHVLASAPPEGRAWRVKHAFGMAGRNQRVIDPSMMTTHALGLVDAWLRGGGGVQIEPEVAIDTEYALHGFIDEGGALRTGQVVIQRCNDRGEWLSTEPVPSLEGIDDIALRLTEEVKRVGRALFGAGYFGPFGVDAFTYRDRCGALVLQPRSEINARYSMGFAVGFGASRRWSTSE